MVYVVIEYGYGYKEPIPTVFNSRDKAEKFALKVRTYNRQCTVIECKVREE